MKKQRLILTLCGLAGLSLAGVIENNCDDLYFNPAASMYIQGDTTSASNLVVKGLSVYPDNGRLKRLMEIIEQQQQDQQDQQDQENQQNQEDQNNEQQQDDQQQNPDEQNNQEQPPEENEQEQEPQPEQPPEENQEQPPPQPQPMDAEQMTEDEAQQLLDAMKQEEQTKRAQLHPVYGSPIKVDKDW